MTLRTFRPGDMGLIASRQAILYAETQAWGTGLELNVLDAVTTFLRGYKPGREQCWIAEHNNTIAGSIFLTDEGDNLARLRLLYVEPSARGLGFGNLLVSTCIDFAHATGYSAITLWTHTVLQSARKLYAAHGFVVHETATHTTFGVPVQGETWKLKL